MILPAVQRVREAANMMVCASNLRQIGVAMQAFARDGYLPTGGGDVKAPGTPFIPTFPWVVTPMPRSFADGFPFQPAGPHQTVSQRQNQDWGWAYQLLPYIEQDGLWQMPGAASDATIAAMAHKVYTCPSRRNPKVLITPTFGSRGALDYAGNAGPFCEWESGGNPSTLGLPGLGTPYDIQVGAGPMWPKPDPRNGMFAKMRHFMSGPPYNPGATMGANNPYFIDPQLRLTDVLDGTSNVILVAEKRVDARANGAPQAGDIIGYTCGLDLDAIRFGGPDHLAIFNALPPAPDRRPVNYVTGFGAAHTTHFNALFVDGSVRPVRYDISPTMVPTTWGNMSLFQFLCDRRDGQAIDWCLIE
jgi:prepilin-type processing-associated H-X9-DG protein